MIPQILKPLEHILEGFLLQEVTIGHSGAGVWRAARDSTYWFVKAHDKTVELEIEANKIRWFATRGLPVANLIDYFYLNDTAFLITEALNGTDASQTSNPKATTIALAHCLRYLHNFKIENCPFDRTLNTTLELAKLNLISGLVDETDFDPIRFGTPAFVVYQQLLEKRNYSAAKSVKLCA